MGETNTVRLTTYVTKSLYARMRKRRAQRSRAFVSDYLRALIEEDVRNL